MRPIDADSFRDHIRNFYCKECIEYNDFIEARCFACRVGDIIEDLEDTNYSPTLDMRPNIHGHWIKGGEAFIGVHKVDEYICSLCDYHTLEAGTYCGNCSAKMDEEVVV